ncbi:MAG: hypothetical protein WAL59_01955 [Roseiarcus sp.]
MRFTNDEVFHNLDGVVETIRLRLNELRPRSTGEIPSPLSGWVREGGRHVRPGFGSSAVDGSLRGMNRVDT